MLSRLKAGITGPLFLGIDTHAVSGPAFASALEVLAANGVVVMIAPTTNTRRRPRSPMPSLRTTAVGPAAGRRHHRHALPQSARRRRLQVQPANGGPADTAVTREIEKLANDYLATGLKSVERMPYKRAVKASTTRRHDFLSAYVNDLGAVVDLEAIRAAAMRMGVDPMGGAGVHYWGG